MLKTLYGNLRYEKKTDLLLLPIKYLYIIYTIPFLIFVLLLTIRSFGAFGNPLKEESGIVKSILLHVATIFISFVIWGILWAIFINN